MTRGIRRIQRGVSVLLLHGMLAISMAAQTRQPTQQALNSDLLAAVEAHDAAKVSILLQQGADPNAFESVYQPPLKHPIPGLQGIDRRRSALLIVVHGAEPIRHPTSPDGTGYETTIGMITRRMSTSELDKRLLIVKALVSRGADVNVQGYMGRTPLMWTVGYKPMAAFLLTHGADVNLRDENGDTALILAADLQLSMVKALVTRGRR